MPSAGHGGAIRSPDKPGGSAHHEPPDPAGSHPGSHPGSRRPRTRFPGHRRIEVYFIAFALSLLVLLVPSSRFDKILICRDKF